MFILAEASFWDWDKTTVIPVVAIAGGLMVGAVAIVGGILSDIMKTRAKEATKREMAAYVAEGSIEPDKAIAMLNAGEKHSSCDENQLM